MDDNTPKSLVNGKPGSTVPVVDRGLQYGDGLFETAAVHDGQICYWRRHWSRLVLGCKKLGITLPDQRALRNDCQSLCKDIAKGVLKIIVTRGEGGRGYFPPSSPHTSCITQLLPWPEYPASYNTQGIVLQLCKTRLGKNPALAGIKHLNRLEQVLASQELASAKFSEGLMLDVDERVIEGIRSNLFLVKNNRLLTPDLGQCGVEGVLRSAVLDLADEMKIPSEIREVELDQVKEADELFMTNSIIGIWPVREFLQQSYAIGPITKCLRETLSLCPKHNHG